MLFLPQEPQFTETIWREGGKSKHEAGGEENIAWAMCCTFVGVVRVAEERAEQRNDGSVWRYVSEKPGAEQLALKTCMISAACMLFATLPVSPYVNPCSSLSQPHQFPRWTPKTAIKIQVPAAGKNFPSYYTTTLPVRTD